MIAATRITRAEALERIKQGLPTFGCVYDCWHSNTFDYMDLLDSDMRNAFLNRFHPSQFTDNDGAVMFLSSIIIQKGNEVVTIPPNEYVIAYDKPHQFTHKAAFYKKYCRTQKAFNKMFSKKKGL